jgi:hypothetical protein
MFARAMCLLVFVFIATVGWASEPGAEDPGAAAAAVSAASEVARQLDVLRDPDLRKLIFFYGRFSPEERERIRTRLRDREVREQIRRLLDDPDRLRAIQSERPELYRTHREHRDLEMQYWELLKQYHESKEDQARQELKEKVRDKLLELTEAETAWYKGELERVTFWIQRLKKRLEERLAQRDDLIQKRFEKDLTELPPRPRLRPGPEERGPGRGERGPRGRPGGPSDNGSSPRRGSSPR